MKTSLKDLLENMNGRSVCFGWAAVAVFSRTALNQLLADQYLDGLNASRFLPPMSGELSLTPENTESATFESIVFGKPVLSFEKSSLAGSTASLTMNIIGGSYTVIHSPVTAAPMLFSHMPITEDMGYFVKLKISLIQVTGNVDQRGRVMFEVDANPTAESNLGSTDSIRKKVAEYIRSYLSNQPDDWRMFELGLLDFNGNNPLSPTRFVIRTQKSVEDETDPDGLVAVFMNVKALDEAAATPIEGSGFPFLIPDDVLQGKPLYSAALVLNYQLRSFVTDEQLDVLGSLLFPGQKVFIERPGEQDRHTPHDLLILGNVVAEPERVTITPSFISLKAGAEQQFTARRSDGTVVNNVEWSVSCPDSPLSEGAMSIGGLYKASERSKMSNEHQFTVVTARYTSGAREYVHSAQVIAVFESMAISPQVAVRGVGATALTVELAVSTLSGGDLVWPTLSPTQGELTVIDNNHARYTPPATIDGTSDVQRIIVTDKLTKETIEATVVLLEWEHKIQINPYFIPFNSLRPVQLEVVMGGPADYYDWEVIGEGNGTIEDGLFTPPDNPLSPISVVRCSESRFGQPIAFGFSIIRLSERQEDHPKWAALEKFSITAPGNLNRCFANGFQQIVVVVEVETQPVEVDHNVYVDIPLSDLELSTMKLVDKISGAEVPFLHFSQEGIEYGTDSWAASKKRNRFRLFNVSNLPSADFLPSTAPKHNRTRYKEFYIHLAVEGSRTFYAQFQAANGATWRSIDKTYENNQIEVTGVQRLPVTDSEYSFVAQRISKDPDGHDAEPSPDYPNGDNMSFYRYSVDFWYLEYRRAGIPVGFATMSVEGNVSSIQWESDQVDETYCSYTGCAFNPANYTNSDSPVAKNISFDPYLWALMRDVYPTELDTSFRGGNPPGPGQLMVSLHRVHDMPYWYDKMAEGDEHKLYRARLDPAMIFVMLDEEGNRHKLRIGFDAPTLDESRNRLVYKPQ
ncbi:hypothetical protein [Pseudomonas sp. QTF5]|uniref:hypothetical protein n=1 Tax=Pseudomonas sp. QTF5 TaxID=1435425 RepID=UPI0004B00D26|nr:hypothetical protein [Pseudomonas sp. QTF5]